MKVTIVEYRPEWKKMFENEKSILQKALGEFPARIEHIGSTAIAGLTAKPIIDIMIGLKDFSAAQSVVPRIEALGYEYISRYEDEMPFRRYFAKDSGGVRTHQIHMVEIGGEFWERHILFRDYLRQNPAVAGQYASLKKELAGREWTDVNEYADAKTQFIKLIEDKAKEKFTAAAPNNNPLDRTRN